MKKDASILLVLFCTVLMMTSCHDEQDMLIAQMEIIKEKGNASPRRALSELDSLWRCSQGGSEYCRQKYNLLRARLCDKADIVATSSDTINKALRYFSKNGSQSEVAEALYYAASTYRDLNDFPQAVSYFEEAVSAMECGQAGEPQLLRNAYSQLCYLYNIELDYDAALKVALKELDFAEKNDIVGSTCIMDVATSYQSLGDSANCRKYCDKALRLFAEGHDTAYDVLAELVQRYVEWNNVEKTKLCMGLLDTLPEDKVPHNIYFALGAYYECIGQADSAACVYEHLASSRNGQKRSQAASYLVDYYRERQDWANLYRTTRTYADAVDSTRSQLQFDMVAKARGERVYRKEKEKELRMKYEAVRSRMMAYCSIALLFFSLSVILYWIYLRNRKTLELLVSKDMEIKAARESLAARNEELCSLNRSIQEKKDLLRSNQEKLETLTKMMLMENAMQYNEEIITLFNNASMGTCSVTEDDWKALFVMVEKMYPEFRMEIETHLQKISVQIMRTCYLMKIGMSNVQISNIMNSARQTTWDRVNRIRASMKDSFEI